MRHGDLRVGPGEVLHGGPVQNAEESDGVVGALGRSDLQAAHGVARAVEGASERCAALGDAAALARAGADGRPLGALEIHVGAGGHVFAVIVVACVHGIAEGRYLTCILDEVGVGLGARARGEDSAVHGPGRGRPAESGEKGERGNNPAEGHRRVRKEADGEGMYGTVRGHGDFLSYGVVGTCGTGHSRRVLRGRPCEAEAPPIAPSV